MYGRSGGTWLAMDRRGRISSLLNVLQPDKDLSPNKKGRGFLVVDYFDTPTCVTPTEYLTKFIKPTCNDYNQFRLVTIDLNQPTARNESIDNKQCDLSSPGAVYSSGTDHCPIPLRWDEVYAFGNNLDENSCWPKLDSARQKFETIVEKQRKCSSESERDNLVEELFGLLSDATHYVPDEQMMMQSGGKFTSHLHLLNSVFVRIPALTYGSR